LQQGRAHHGIESSDPKTNRLLYRGCAFTQFAIQIPKWHVVECRAMPFLIENSCPQNKQNVECWSSICSIAIQVPKWRDVECWPCFDIIDN
jgi:hypothetical protein